TRLRIPQAHGGYGLSLPQAYEFFVALAAADSNLDQALRAHWSFVEDVLSRPNEQSAFVQRWLGRLGSGVIIGNAITARGNQHGTNTTRVTRRDCQQILYRTSYYATGTAYADWTAVSATAHVVPPISLTVSAELSVVETVAPWVPFGQALTASGATPSTAFTVYDIEISPAAL